MPAVFISLPSCLILKLEERFCSRTCSFLLPPLYRTEHGFAQGMDSSLLQPRAALARSSNPHPSATGGLKHT